MGSFFNMQQMLPVIITVLVLLVGGAVYILYSLQQMRKKTKGKIKVRFNTLERTEYTALCTKDGEDCIIPPMGKEYEKLTGKQRTSDLPPIYFVHHSKMKLCEYPETGMALAKVLMPTIEYNEWNAEPVDPYDQDYIVSAELVSAKTRREVSKFLVYSTRDQLRVIEEIERVLKAGKQMLNPMYIYIGLGLAILAAGYSAYQGMQIQKLLAP